MAAVAKTSIATNENMVDGINLYDRRREGGVTQPSCQQWAAAISEQSVYIHLLPICCDRWILALTVQCYIFVQCRFILKQYDISFELYQAAGLPIAIFGEPGMKVNLSDEMAIRDLF